MKQNIYKLSLATLLSLSVIDSNAEMTEEVKQVQSRWADVNYMPTQNDEQEEAKVKAFEQLSQLASQVALKKENQPEALVWEGIVYSSYAGAKGGLGALSLAKHAKASYEEAIKINGDVLDGSAYTSLGVLYSKVPGWPVGFGSDKKALQFLEQGLARNPDGIDANYFYAEFMYEEEEDYHKAKQHLLKAKQAAPRADRISADEGRLQEITRLMAQVEEELAD
jgi:tetratricopeptide (TPR) repeat protein